MHNLYAIVSNNFNQITNEINSLTGELTDYDYVSFDFEDSSLIRLLEEVRTVPLLNEGKIVVLKNATFLSNPSKYDERLINSFKDYLQNPSPSTVLNIVISELKSINVDFKAILEKNAIIKSLIKNAPEDLKAYISNSFLQDGYLLDSLVVDELIDRTKGFVERIDVEIDKLKTYACDSKKILNSDVKLLVSKELDDNIFELVNGVLENDKPKIYQIFNDLMTLNTTETVIISLLINKFSELYDTKVLTKAGYSKNDIADLYNIKPGRVYYAQKAAQSASLEDLRNNINDLCELDYKIKSGQIDKRIGLELYLAK